MITIEKIINNEFANASIDDIVSKISAHNLFEFTSKAIELVNVHLDNKKFELEKYNIIKIESVVSSLLIGINEHLRSLKKKTDTEIEELEYLFSNISIGLLKAILEEIPDQNKAGQVTSIYDCLKDTCTLYKYNFEALSDFLQIEDLVRNIYVKVQMISKNNENLIDRTISNNMPGYKCTYTHFEPKMPKLLDIMKQLKITDDIEKFGELFNSPSKNLAIKLNENRDTYVMQFLTYLYSLQVIESNNKKFGYYQVLECHVINFKQTFLRGATGQKGSERVRRLKDWDTRREEFENIFLKL